MHAHKLLAPLLAGGQRERAPAQPEDVLRQDIARPGLELAPAVGATATGAAKAGLGSRDTVEAFNQESHVDQLRANYLDPKVKMSLAGQLEVMTAFWADLGKEVPALTSTQQQQLLSVLEANPTKRVIPTLLTASLVERVNIAEDAKQFPKNELNSKPDVKALWTPPRGIGIMANYLKSLNLLS